MEANDIFRQGLGVIPRPPQIHHFYRPPIPHHHLPTSHQFRNNDADGDGSSHRIAHTLTACCRCRQRKTRCDPTLPRCLPCERSNSVCEYYDTTKGKKISRNYVVKLQDKVRQLETELALYTEEDSDYPRNHEEIVRPGGMVRLNETDETPRYLGPSSGIAMTRLLMEEAKRYTDSKRIAELIPAVRARRVERMNRMQSIVATSVRGSISGRRKSYPMISGVPAQNLPTRQIMDKLVEVFCQRAQIFTPVLHEKTFADDLEAVCGGDKDPYKNFVVRMVVAISLQKLDITYAGLADSYYLAAMQLFEAIIRPKDLKTLQCLVLIGQYSLLTPTRTATYYIIGLATRICQQLGLGEEKTIAMGGNINPLALDMRRRLSWIVSTMEFGLAHCMGRPSGFAKGDDSMNVEFFQTVDDELITEEGIQQGPPSEKKEVAIHFCKMRLLQAEIRRMLYERKRPEPKQESHPWFGQMEHKMDEWRKSSPEKPEWCELWFTGRYHAMMVTLYRPSPQIPKPTSRAALQCFESSVFIIQLSSQQVKKAAVDVTWVFLLNLYMSLNALLWSLSYPEVRAKHPRDEVEDLVQVAIDVIDQCSERWPESRPTSELYQVFAKACMQSYDMKEGTPNSAFNTPPLTAETSSPSTSETSVTTIGTGPGSQHAPGPIFNTAFGYAFDSSAAFNHENNQHPTFRSNSIFYNPATEMYGRRASSFPPDFSHPKQEQWMEPADDSTPPATATPHLSNSSPPTATPYYDRTPPIPDHIPNAIPTPPESLAPAPTIVPSNPSLSPRPNVMDMNGTPSPGLPMNHASPAASMVIQSSPTPMSSLTQPGFGSPMMSKQEQNMSMPPPPRTNPFTIPPTPQHQPNTQQRSLPPVTAVTDWFSPPPPLISPYAPTFSSAANGGYWNEASNGAGGQGGPGTPQAASFSGLSLNNGLESYTLGGREGPGALMGGAMVTSGGPTFGLYTGTTNGMGGVVPNGLPSPYIFPPERHGSLSLEQQTELMDVLENEGMGDIDSFLSMNMNLGMPVGSVDRGGIRWG